MQTMTSPFLSLLKDNIIFGQVHNVMKNLHTHVDQSLKTTSYTAREEREREGGGGKDSCIPIVLGELTHQPEVAG